MHNLVSYLFFKYLPKTNFKKNTLLASLSALNEEIPLMHVSACIYTYVFVQGSLPGFQFGGKKEEELLRSTLFKLLEAIELYAKEVVCTYVCVKASMCILYIYLI